MEWREDWHITWNLRCEGLPPCSVPKSTSLQDWNWMPNSAKLYHGFYHLQKGGLEVRCSQNVVPPNGARLGWWLLSTSISCQGTAPISEWRWDFWTSSSRSWCLFFLFPHVLPTGEQHWGFLRDLSNRLDPNSAPAKAQCGDGLTPHSKSNHRTCPPSHIVPKRHITHMMCPHVRCKIVR